MKNNSAVETAQPAIEAPADQSARSILENAQARVDAIKDQILDGDENMTPGDLAKAQAALTAAQDDFEFAKLREEAARNREIKKAETDHRENLLKLQSGLIKLSDTSDLEKLLKKVSESVGKFLAAASDREAQLREIHGAIDEGGYLPGSIAPISDLPAIVERNLTKIGAVEVEAFSIKSKLDQTIQEITREYYPRGLF